MAQPISVHITADGLVLPVTPQSVELGTTFVETYWSEPWLTLENANAVKRPAGPPDDPDGPGLLHTGERHDAHTFRHADAIIFHTVDGDVRYRVVQQPDKYVREDPDGPIDPEAAVTPEHYAAGQTDVANYYGLELES